MKKSFPILILFIFLLHLAGFYIYFAVQLNQIHQEMRSKLKALPAEQLQVFSLSIKTYTQNLRDDGDEIEINDKMYDIARVEIKSEWVIVYAIHDSEEDNLLSFIDQVLKNATQDSQRVPSPLFQFSALTFILPSVYNFEVISSTTFSSFTYYFASVESFVPSLDTPPPRG